MANVKFFKGDLTNYTKAYEAGGIYFDSASREIRLGNGGTGTAGYTAYGNHIKDAVFSGGILTISYYDKDSVSLNFNDLASAEATMKAFQELDNKIAALEAKAPVAGKDIDITGANNAIDVALDEAITVMGVSVGTLANGSTLKKGMSLSDILKKILIREIDAKVGAKPSVTIGVTGVTSNGTYEVGTSLTATLSHTYTDGKFVGADSLYQYNLAAGCAEGATTYKFDTTTVTSPHSLVVTEGSHTFNCTTTYGASTASPVKNNGTASTVSIPAGSATSGNFGFTGKFYGYVGYSTKTAGSQFDSASIKKLAAAKEYLTINGSTTLLPGGATSDGTSIVIAVPAKYKLAGIQNSLGVSILENFDAPVQVNYTNGETTTAYKVYVYPITSGAQVAYKNVVITKA